jgi:hypothetical protein
MVASLGAKHFDPPSGHDWPKPAFRWVMGVVEVIIKRCKIAQYHSHIDIFQSSPEASRLAIYRKRCMRTYNTAT